MSAFSKSIARRAQAEFASQYGGILTVALKRNRRPPWRLHNGKPKKHSQPA